MVRPVLESDIGLKTLREPAATEDAASIVDIVAVHGIGAHPADTWKKKIEDAEGGEARYVDWLRDEHMLHAAVPKSRIMRYGYESQWFGNEVISTNASSVAQRLLLALKRARKDHQSRPIIFICHCFGGLVVLKALVDAKHVESRWPGIFISTTGLIFLGTPFRGAGGLDQSEMLRVVHSQYEEGQVRASVLNILAPGNETLKDLMDMFFETRKEKHKAQVACFFEQKPCNVGAIVKGERVTRLVVDEISGCLDQSEATLKFSLSRDHFSMNNFGSPEEEDFMTLSDVIQEMVSESAALILARGSEGKRVS